MNSFPQIRDARVIKRRPKFSDLRFEIAVNLLRPKNEKWHTNK
jgi:hypothetical protein